MSSARPARERSPRRVPALRESVGWAMQRGSEGGGASRWRLVARTVAGNMMHARALQRWMGVVFELKSRGVIDDLEGEYLRAIRPYVHRHTGLVERVTNLIDHTDWLETAFQPAALERLAAGKPVVLADLPPPRGWESMRLQLRRTGVTSPEGELLLTLTMLRSPDIQHKALPVDASAIAFSRFRVEGTPCLVIGGVRGQRSAVGRMSPVEVSQALQGWKPSVLLVRVMQELARAWGLTLIGLNPASHRLQGVSYRVNKRHRENAERIYGSYEALWNHFDATSGPLGWVVLPLHSDEKLAATALSPEKRERQSRRADYWIRMRKLLRQQMRDVLLRGQREEKLSRVTQQITDHAPLQDEWADLADDDDDDNMPSRVLDTGPGSLI